VQYLVKYGEDPDEQLCTDDFAGHLAHNVNLAAKAIIGVACYARLTGEESYAKQAKTMAEHLLEKIGDKGNTPLTLDGQGWSMKYNLLWDKVLGLGLMPESFYAAETASYLPRINTCRWIPAPIIPSRTGSAGRPAWRTTRPFAPH